MSYTSSEINNDNHAPDPVSQFGQAIPIAGPQKAVIAAILSGVLAFLSPIQVTLLHGDPITALTWVDALVAALISAVALFNGVYFTTNRVTSH